MPCHAIPFCHDSCVTALQAAFQPPPGHCKGSQQLHGGRGQLGLLPEKSCGQGAGGRQIFAAALHPVPKALAPAVSPPLGEGAVGEVPSSSRASQCLCPADHRGECSR